MSILKYKYQAHKLINYIFYIIVFCIGFVIGFTSKNVDINKILSNVLFIDNVSAYTIYEDNDIVVDEHFILNEFLSVNNNFNYDNYPNVLCELNSSHSLVCYFFDDYTINNLIYDSNYTNVNYSFHYNFPNSINFYRFYYEIPTSFKGYNFLSNSDIAGFTISFASADNFVYYSNFLPNEPNRITQYSDELNVLDFITPQLNYNENLFASNDDFKQVCVNSTDTFLISSNDYNKGGHVLADYLWFPYNVKGIEQGVYKTSDDSLIFNDEIEKYFFKNAKKINKTFDESSGLPFSTYSYPFEDRYNYFGWLAVPFIITYDENDYMFYTFRFKEDTTISYYDDIDSGGGGGTYFGEGEEPPTEYCFYINKLYEVQILDSDNNGNYYGTVVTPEGEINVYSSNDNSFFSSFNDNDFGLSTIITAPLRAIRKIGKGTCSPQNVPLLNKNVTIPCGNTIFWDRQDVSTFKIFWNMFWGGILCYGIGVSLYRLIHRLRNPLDDKVEVLDL